MASKKFTLYKTDLTENITTYSSELSADNVELVALFSYYTGLIPELAAEILGTLKGHDHTSVENDHCLAKALHYIPAGQIRKSLHTPGQSKETVKDDFAFIISSIITLLGGTPTEATKTLVKEVKEKVGLVDATANLDNDADGKVDADDVKIAKDIVSTVVFEEGSEE